MISSLSIRTIALVLAIAACFGIAAQSAVYTPTEEHLRAREEVHDHKLGGFTPLRR